MANMGWSYLTKADKAAILRGIRDGRAYGGPYHVEIHPADRCNVECFFCSTAAIRGTDEIPLDRMRELVAQMKAAGTHSVRLSGGGEPLFHRRIADFLSSVGEAGLRIENVTTNGVLLRADAADLLLRYADDITVSINTADEASYAEMMQTPARNYGRVVENTKQFLSRRKGRLPRVTLQFLVWKGNFTTIPAMYALARELGADRILFNGLSGLRPEQKMDERETSEMLRLYADLVRIDEYRHIVSIESYEQDIAPAIGAISDTLTRERSGRGTVRRALDFVTRRDGSIADRLRHHFDFRRQRQRSEMSRGFREACLIGWHSMLIRTTGTVAPCCIMQDARLGNAFEQSIDEVWYGEGYAAFRRELSRILVQGESWQHDPAADRTVAPLCAVGKCPASTFWFGDDFPFRRQLDAIARGV